MDMMVRRSRAAVLLTMCAGMFLVQLDVTVVNVALPTMGAELGADLPRLQWIVDGYSVVLAALLLCGGAVGDVFGHRRVVVAGFAVFGCASVLCGLAWSAPVLVGGRVLQGLGAALLLPGTLAVITRTYPERGEQARALGIWAGVSAVALSAGPLLGGLLVHAAGWRSLFWLNVPLAACAIAGTTALVRAEGTVPGRRVDVPGALTAAVALAAAVYAVIRAGAGEAPWLAGTIAVVAAAGFVAVERRSADPMLPLGLLRDRRFTGANLVAGAMNFVGLGTILVATLYLQRVLGSDPLTAGLRMLPIFAPLALLAPVTGRLTARFGPRPPMIAGLALGVVSLLGLLFVRETSGYPTFLLPMAGLGTAMGLLTAAVVAAAVGAVPPERAGVASGVNNTARQAAGALGVAVFGAVVGEPARVGEFVGGVHTLGLFGAALWLAAIGVTAYAIRPVRETELRGKSALERHEIS
ncbi:MFS transporter [Amycolatopsis anabasis]|uniref:MFS transporter n=1 Tax=Amycolatopsis anabasis TaxID=1840409 RepID=UPI001FE65E64|nr:MFS transporter [Amycolatopsis anabasis]